jgi:hypothetical protein
MMQWPDAIGSHRGRHWDAGFRPVPVYNYDAKVPSPGKQPLGPIAVLIHRRSAIWAVLDRVTVQCRNANDRRTLSCSSRHVASAEPIWPMP